MHKSHQVFKYDARESVLLIVDVQKDFCSPEDGCAYYERQKMDRNHTDDLDSIKITLTKKIIPFLNKARKSLAEVVFIQSCYELNQFDSELPMSHLCIKGTYGWQLHKVSPHKNEKIFEKSTHNAFSNKQLSDYLRAKKISNIFILGFTTDNCIYHTTLGIVEKGFKAIVVEDSVSTAKYKYENVHVRTINHLRSHSNVAVLKSNEIMLV